MYRSLERLGRTLYTIVTWPLDKLKNTAEQFATNQLRLQQPETELERRVEHTTTALYAAQRKIDRLEGFVDRLSIIRRQQGSALRDLTTKLRKGYFPKDVLSTLREDAVRQAETLTYHNETTNNEMIFTLSPEGVLTRASKRAIEVFGSSRIGTPYSTLISDENERSSFDFMLSKWGVSEYMTHLITPDGKTRSYHAGFLPLTSTLTKNRVSAFVYLVPEGLVERMHVRGFFAKLAGLTAKHNKLGKISGLTESEI